MKMLTRKWKVFILASFLGLSACAAGPAPEIVQRGPFTVFQGTQAQVEELCRQSENVENNFRGGRILGCWLPERRTIAFEQNNWCIGLHEALHALGWEHGSRPNATCDGRDESWRTRMNSALRETAETSAIRRR